MNEQNMLQMLNAMSDEIFMAIVRGNATCESCQDDREFISKLRENILSKQETDLDFEKFSDVMIKMFEKYRAKNLNSVLQI
ncbi:MAG: nicotinate phosphoribosyltransferase [Campylobacter sp.]|nr:nicotinate phosphoribosyltransferase [Campylobacter sp.]